MSNGVCIYDVVDDGKDFVFADINKAGERIAHVTRAGIIGKSIYDIRPNIEEYGLVDVFRRVWKSGEPEVHSEKLYQDNDLSGYFRNYVYRLSSGEIVAIFEDLTKQKRSDAALHSAEERYDLAMKATSDGVYDWNLKTNEIYYSPAWKRMLGYEDHELPNDFSIWETLTEPEDVKRSWAALNEMIERKRDGFELEFRMRHKDGHWVDILSRADAEFDSSGTAIRVVGTHVNITERKQAEARLKESEQKQRSILKAIPDQMFVLSGEGKILDFYSTDIEKLYVPPQEFEGKTIEKVLPKKVAKVIAEHVQKAIQTDSIQVFEYSLDYGGEGKTYFEARMVTSGANQVIAIVRDVTEQRHAESTLRETDARHSAMIENIGDVIAIMDADGTTKYQSPNIERWFGWKPEDLIGKSGWDKMHPDDVERIQKEFVEMLEKGDASTVELRFECKDGNYKWIEITAVNRIDEPAINGVLLNYHDISERKHVEQQRLDLERQVQHAQKLESLGVLAGGIAHDFNNLLVGMLGNADLALSELSPLSPARESIQQIEIAAMRAAELSKQMLAYSGKGKFVVKELDLNEMIEEMAHLLEVSKSKNVVLKYNFANNLPAVEADATQLRQVIMNLITNASEAIEDKSGVVSISTGAMECDRAYFNDSYLDEDQPEGMYTFVEVTDTGCGMDVETIGKIFDPFFTTKFTGRGLGMAALLGIIRGHNGAIKIYSEEGKGTTIKVLFPALGFAADSGGSKKRSSGEKGDDWTFDGTVLIVDDEELVLIVGKAILEKHGITVLTAEDGRAALHVFEEQKDDISCVILDLTMPHMGGEETFRELRRIKRDVKVIISSGYNEQDVMDRFVGKGLAGFIQKPYRKKDLVKMLREVLEGTKDLD
jgi:PAS domain S-box-containing protein